MVSSRVLARQGYRYIVVHESFYPKFKLTQTHQLLKALFDEPKDTMMVLWYINYRHFQVEKNHESVVEGNTARVYSCFRLVCCSRISVDLVPMVIHPTEVIVGGGELVGGFGVSGGIIAR